MGVSKRMRGERLAVMTNGGGIGVMAVDRLITEGGHLAELSPGTISQLDEVLPETWSRANPVDIIGDAPGQRYSDALGILGAAKEVDAVLVMHAPTATASSTEAAAAVIEAARGLKANILTSWVGGEAVAPARKLFRDAGLPTYDTPGQAVAAFMHMIDYQRNQETLMETPLSTPEEFTPSVSAARMIIDSQIASGSDMLSEPQAKAVLDAYGIPVVETLVARSPEEAATKAADIGFPVALKILADGISHKSDVGGVALLLETADSVKTAAEQMLKRVAKRAPDADVQGFSVQHMVLRPGVQETIVGINQDPVFGPVILFGHGGTAVEVIEDSAVALPPLNMNLARDMISRTRISKLLAGYRDRPAADVDRLSLALMQIAQIAIDIRSDLKGHGLGWKLFEKMVAYCRKRGTREMVGQVLSDNTTMLKFIDQWGFERHKMPDEPIYEVRMVL